ncbi:hypothetical protein [Roseibium sp. RKSG952]|uniref:hypothetical protein n=1 Tax=Roseibium sp. RKSG952 TaxID=2529384 RepID=UPI0013CAACBE|nr:hypothetical protein [Roseibium sp. RKSG952]MTI01775.1 hypothetical protein [Roseibium sp. RKSG952]
MTTGRVIRRAFAGLLAALLPAQAPAQTVITPDEFLDAVVGKTIKFYEVRSGFLVGTEQFLNRSTSVWRMEGRGCVYGQITTPNGQICFLYDDDPDGIPVCWWPFLYEDRLLVRLATFLNSETQEVRSITEDGVNCPSTPIS